METFAIGDLKTSIRQHIHRVGTSGEGVHSNGERFEDGKTVDDELIGSRKAVGADREGLQHFERVHLESGVLEWREAVGSGHFQVVEIPSGRDGKLVIRVTTMKGKGTLLRI